MEKADRLSCLDLSIKLIEAEYGEQKDINVLLNLLNKEFPDDNYIIEEIHELSSFVYEVEEKEILFEHLGLNTEQYD